MQLTNFDTHIEELLDHLDANSIFLSSWDKSDNTLDFPTEIIKKTYENAIKDSNHYFFSDELESLKKSFSKNILENKISHKNIAITSNGTISSSLILQSLLQKQNLKVLLIAPMYFTYIRMLQDWNITTHYYPIDFDHIQNNLPNIIKYIKDNNINLVIVNNPLFGTGIGLDIFSLKVLLKECTLQDCYLLLDNIYGNMYWNGDISIVDIDILDLVNQSNYFICIDSISKKIFLNGIKNSIITGPTNIINKIEEKSVYLVGSIASSQIEMFKELYNPKNKDTLKKIIERNLITCCNNFSLIKSLILGTDFNLLPCNQGYFCLLGIPKRNFNEKEDMKIALRIIKETNVLTIPHQRYLLYNETYYYFRINLSLDTFILIKGINKLLENYF